MKAIHGHDHGEFDAGRRARVDCGTHRVRECGFSSTRGSSDGDEALRPRVGEVLGEQGVPPLGDDVFKRARGGGGEDAWKDVLLMRSVRSSAAL